MTRYLSHVALVERRRRLRAADRRARSRPCRDTDRLVSGAVPSFRRRDRSGPLGPPHPRALVHRGWRACVVAIVIALLGAGGGKKEWTARAIVNEGQPYTSTNSPIAASLGTNPSAAGTLLKQDVVIKFVAGKVGLRPGQLKAAISTQPVGQPNAKVNFTPLVAVIVSGPWKTKVRRRREPARAAVRAPGQPVPARSPRPRCRRSVNQEASQLKVLADPREGRGRELPADPQGAGHDPRTRSRRTSRSGS